MYGQDRRLELATNLRENFTITEKTPRHYAKQAPKYRKKISRCDIGTPMKRLEGRRERFLDSPMISPELPRCRGGQGPV